MLAGAWRLVGAQDHLGAKRPLTTAKPEMIGLRHLMVMQDPPVHAESSQAGVARLRATTSLRRATEVLDSSLSGSTAHNGSGDIVTKPLPSMVVAHYLVPEEGLDLDGWLSWRRERG